MAFHSAAGASNSAQDVEHAVGVLHSAQSARSVSKNSFRHAARLRKSSEDKQLTLVGVHRYGRA